LEGASSAKLFGELIDVKARIEKLDGVSGHADKEGLVKWVSSFEPKPEKVYVVHGEDKVCEIFADYLRKELGLDAEAPYTGSVYELESNKMIKEGDRNRIPAKKASAKRASAVFARLLAAGQRLMYIIGKSEELANKDIAKFADQINSLCDKWED
jgi:metallo-beta-lactamase family protein